MKSRYGIVIAFIVALAVIVGTASAYIWMFGVSPSSNHEKWGQFGDYFGGLLNPLFAMLAFLAVLQSIELQEREARKATDRFNEQIDLSRQEMNEIRQERIAQDLLHVIKDIDTRIESILRLDASAPGAAPVLAIFHMVSEAERYATTEAGEFDAYHDFISRAMTSGSPAEASVRELVYLVEKMREFLEQYSALKSGKYVPLIVYYADKVFQLLHMLEHLGRTQDDTRKFFAMVSDPHH